MKRKPFFHTELSRGVYMISDPEHGPTEDGKSLLPGKATANSYLIVGNAAALLFDLAINKPGLSRYAQELARVPLRIVLSHAHIDHIFHIAEEKEVWLHPDDERLLRRGAFPFQPPLLKCPQLRYLRGGDIVDLAGRVLDVIHIPGHTDGSILLYDRESKLLLSGDTCTRRLLYGLHTFVPIETFCAALEALNAMDIAGIYSAHDRCCLPKARIGLMCELLRARVPQSLKRVTIPAVGTLAVLSAGDEDSLDYFDFAMPARYAKQSNATAGMDMP